MGFFWSHNLWVSRVEVFAALYGTMAQSALGTEHALLLYLLLLFDTPFPGLKRHYKWYGAIVFPVGF